MNTGSWSGDTIKQYKPYQLTALDGIVLKENRIILPQSLQKCAVHIAHHGHLGKTKKKALLNFGLHCAKV